LVLEHVELQQPCRRPALIRHDSARGRNYARNAHTEVSRRRPCASPRHGENPSSVPLPCHPEVAERDDSRKRIGRNQSFSASEAVARIEVEPAVLPTAPPDLNHRARERDLNLRQHASKHAGVDELWSTSPLMLSTPEPATSVAFSPPADSVFATCCSPWSEGWCLLTRLLRGRPSGPPRWPRSSPGARTVGARRT
jgi:hypothetical protein